MKKIGDFMKKFYILLTTYLMVVIIVFTIEVKAEENLRAKSLRQVVTNNPSLHGLRFSMSSYRHEDWLDNVPLYGVEARFSGTIK